MNKNWKYVPFDQFFEWKDKSLIKSGAGGKEGRYPLFVCSDTEIKRYDDFLIDDEAIVFGTGGKASCHYVNEKFAYSTDCVVAVKKTKSILTKFYYYYFRQNRLGLLQATFKGSGLQHTSKKKISDILVPDISISEQIKVVDYIETVLSKLDDGIETLKKTKQQLSVYRQAVLKSAFNSIGGEIKSLKDLCFFITKGTTPPKNKMYTSNGDIPFIKVYNLTFDTSLDFSIDPTYVGKETHLGFLSRSIVLPGDVLMNIVGPPMGKVSIVPDTYPEWNINQAIVRFRCYDKLNNKYLAYYLGFEESVEKMKSKSKATAGQFNLTLEICRELQIPVPSIEVQKEIVLMLDSKLSLRNKIENTVDSALQEAESLRQSILKQAFEGEL